MPDMVVEKREKERRMGEDLLLSLSFWANAPLFIYSGDTRRSRAN
jgi:hypothetical protein